MGSLAGVFNACSTLFTVDLYEKWKPKATQHQIVRTGRIATAVMVLIALAWIPVVEGRQQPVRIPAEHSGIPGPADLRGLLLRRVLQAAQRQGLLWAMVVGFILGVFRMLVDTPVTMKMPGFEDGYTPGSFLWIVNNIYLPVLQHPHHDCFGGGDGGGELHDLPAAGSADPEPDLRHRNRGRQAEDAGELGLAGGGRLGLRAGGDPGGVFVFPRVNRTSSWHVTEIRWCVMTDQNPTQLASPPGLPRFLPLLLVLFVGSGCSALIYEIVWFQSAATRHRFVGGFPGCLAGDFHGWDVPRQPRLAADYFPAAAPLAGLRFA